MKTTQTPSDPALYLVTLAKAVAAGCPPSEEVKQWFLGGVSGFLGSEPLETALGLKGNTDGSRSPRWRLQEHERNRAIRRALAACDGSPTDLEKQIRRFESVTWPRWADLSAPPAYAKPVQRALWDAFKAGIGVPTTARQLRNITRQQP